MRRHPIVQIQRYTSLVARDAAASLADALLYQANYHFGPSWDAGCSLMIQQDPGEAPPPGVWTLALLDDSDQAGALGYHEVGPNGSPAAKVFVAEDRRAGLSWTVTASHELLELLGDPFANQCVQIDEQTFVAYEACDAVESDDLGYKVKGVLLSDFMTPGWFDPESLGPFDHAEHCDAPLQILPGGYIGVWTPKDGWRQEVNGRARHQAGPRFRLRSGYNKAARTVGHGRITLGRGAEE